MADLYISLAVRPKWWFRPALWAACIAVWLGFVRDADSAEHYSGRITAEERASKWLANYALRFEVC
jgi:hypothetical protein